MLPMEIEDALRDLGVTYEALAMPPRVGYSRAIFRDDSTFADLAEFGTRQGDRAIMLPTIDHGEVVDWSAWSLDTNRLAMLVGAYGIVGDMELIFNPATYLDGGALHVCDGPIDWLLRKRDGIVVVDPALAVPHLLAARKISVSSPTMQQRVRLWFKRTVPQIVRAGEQGRQ